ncbi:fibronectin type III domain-containing protein, partial [candidate division KSB1 bacterium]|nr:fibronectin type III domain-containing protein [candidate division KSB1 bacterium]
MKIKTHDYHQSGRAHNRTEKVRRFFLSVALLLVVFLTEAPAGSLLITWAANTEADLAGYRIYYGIESSNYTDMKDVGNVTSYVLDGLEVGQTYYIVVTAYDFNNNESAPSLQVSAMVAQADIYVEAVETGIHLRWTSLPGADRYEVYSDADPYFLPSTPIASLTTNEYTDPFDRQAPYLARYYTVKAYNEAQTIYTFDRVGAFNLTLSYPKNLVSLPLIPSDLSLNRILGAQLSGATNSVMADKILYWNGNDFEIAWLVEGSGSIMDGKWVTQAGDQISALQLDPDRSFWIWLYTYPSDSIITVAGKVSDTADRLVTLQQGMNFIGTCYPVA